MLLYGADDAPSATLLCDRHDAGAVAYGIVASDLTTQGVTYGALRRDSERFAAVLQAMGVGPGTRVAT